MAALIVIALAGVVVGGYFGLLIGLWIATPDENTPDGYDK